MSGLVLAGTGLTLVDPTGANVSIGVGSTPVTGGTSGFLLYNNGGVLGNTSAATVPLTVNTTPIIGGATGSVLYDNAGTVGELLTTGSGSVVLSTGATLTTPTLLTATLTGGVFSGVTLGTPVSGTATNLTGLPLTTGVTGLLPVANGGTNSPSGISAMTALSGVYVLAMSGVSATTAGTTEGTGIQLFANVPAGAMGLNGIIEFEMQLDTKACTSAATVDVRYVTGSGAGTSGTALIASSLGANLTQLIHVRVSNAGAANAQFANASLAPYASTANAFGLSAIDSTTATVLRVNVFPATGGGTVAVRGYQYKLLASGGT